MDIIIIIDIMNIHGFGNNDGGGKGGGRGGVTKTVKSGNTQVITKK